jgi:hypothetical protein
MARRTRRAKNGKPSARPLRDDEVRALRELRRQFPDSTFVFATERGGPFTPDAAARVAAWSNKATIGLGNPAPTSTGAPLIFPFWEPTPSVIVAAAFGSRVGTQQLLLAVACLMLRQLSL